MIETVAALKRTLTPGTKLRIVNHLHPRLCRDTEVHPKTNTVDLVTWGETVKGDQMPFHMSWPKRADFRPDESDPLTVHVDSGGKPFMTITILKGDA